MKLTNIITDVVVDLAIYRYVASPLTKNELGRTVISVLAWYAVNPIINRMFEKADGQLPQPR